jgi:multimeric flavodoxin WrbA
MTHEIQVAVAFHSGFGHTARQAQAVVDGAASVAGTVARLWPVDTLDDQLWEGLAAADAIVFGTPTYMGAPSAVFKHFAEATSSIYAAGGWKDKVAAGFTNSQTINGDKLNTLVDLAVLAAQHGMHWVSLGLPAGWDSTSSTPDDLNRLGSWLGAMAQSNSDQGPTDAPPASDLATAAALGRRVAEVTAQLARGRAAAGAAAA